MNLTHTPFRAPHIRKRCIFILMYFKSPTYILPHRMTIQDKWWLMVRVPLAIVLTMYTLFVAGRYDPGSFTSGMFSALYVQLVGQTWKYQPNW